MPEFSKNDIDAAFARAVEDIRNDTGRQQDLNKFNYTQRLLYSGDPVSIMPPTLLYEIALVAMKDLLIQLVVGQMEKETEE